MRAGPKSWAQDHSLLSPITELSKRRTKSDNVKAEFYGGPGWLLCSTDNYGADKTWVLVGEVVGEQGRATESPNWCLRRASVLNIANLPVRNFSSGD